MNKSIGLNIVFTTIMAISISLSGFAQEQLFVNNEQPERQKFMVHYSLTQHFNFIRPSFRVGIENRLTEFIHLNAEMGYIYRGADRSFWSASNFPRWGYHFAIEPKIYPFESPNRRLRSSYFSFVVSFDKIMEEQNNFVPRAGGAYQERLEFKVSELTTTQMITFGRTLFHTDPMNVDAYVGLGVRNSFIRSSGLPDDVEEQDVRPSFSQWRGRNNYRPAFQIGILLTFPGLHYPKNNYVIEKSGI